MVVLALSAEQAKAQRWKRFRQELTFGVGVSNFLGDLGGASSGEGGRFSDFQFSTTRYALNGAFGYKFTERINVKAGITYGMLSADDSKSANESRKNRNLSVRTHLMELGVTGEFYFLKENVGGVYRIRGMRGSTLQNIAAYGFMGFGIAYFNPQGKNEAGQWVNLAPLNTEGQGLPGGKSDYSQITLVTPMGLGVKYKMDRQWSIGFEFGLRLTTTDYLDDTSGRFYYDKPALMDAEQLYFADRRLDDYKGSGAGVRGNPDKTDTYMFGMFTVSYKMKSTYRNRTRF